MPGELPGEGAMFKLRFDWYITFASDHQRKYCVPTRKKKTSKKAKEDKRQESYTASRESITSQKPSSKA